MVCKDNTIPMEENAGQESTGQEGKMSDPDGTGNTEKVRNTENSESTKVTNNISVEISVKTSVVSTLVALVTVTSDVSKAKHNRKAITFFTLAAKFHRDVE